MPYKQQSVRLPNANHLPLDQFGAKNLVRSVGRLLVRYEHPLEDICYGTLGGSQQPGRFERSSGIARFAVLKTTDRLRYSCGRSSGEPFIRITVVGFTSTSWPSSPGTSISPCRSFRLARLTGIGALSYSSRTIRGREIAQAGRSLQIPSCCWYRLPHRLRSVSAGPERRCCAGSRERAHRAPNALDGSTAADPGMLSAPKTAQIVWRDWLRCYVASVLPSGHSKGRQRRTGTGLVVVVLDQRLEPPV